MCYSFVMARRPLGPLALIVLCRCDRVFWDYSSLFTCGALHLCCSKFCSTHVCLSGLTLGNKSRCLLTKGIVKPHMRDDRIFSSGPITAQPVRTREKTRLPSTFHASSLHSNGSIIYPYYQMCIHVWMWWVCMCPTRPTWNEKCIHMRMCAQTFWVPVFLILLVQTGNSPFLKSLVVRTLFVPHWNQETRSQPNDSFYLNGLLYSFTTTLYLSNS